jgi:hypothetical protein
MWHDSGPAESRKTEEVAMTEEDLERVSGVSRYHERMWIQRDESGKIKQVFDGDLKPIETMMLYRSFECETQENGFVYKGEFIPLEGAREYARKRSQGYQRRNYGHSIEEVL